MADIPIPVPFEDSIPTPVAFDDSADRIGSLSRALESGGDSSSVSSGKGDIGGKSFGLYQIATKNGTMQDFLGYADKAAPSIAARLRSASINGRLSGEWKALAKEDPATFDDLQHKFVEDRHYAPVVAEAQKFGIDPTTRSKALNEYIFSTAVHMGPGLASKALKNALQGVNVAALTDQDIIYRLSSEKGRTGPNGGLSYWGSSPAKTQQQVADRLLRERDMALDMYDQEQSAQVPTLGVVEQAVPTAPVLSAPPQVNAMSPTYQESLAQPFARDNMLSPNVDRYEQASQQGASATVSQAPLQAVARTMREGGTVDDYGDATEVIKPVAPNPAAGARIAGQLGMAGPESLDNMFGGSAVTQGPLSRRDTRIPDSSQLISRASPETPADIRTMQQLGINTPDTAPSIGQTATDAGPLTRNTTLGEPYSEHRTLRLIGQNMKEFFVDNPRSFTKGTAEALRDSFRAQMAEGEMGDDQRANSEFVANIADRLAKHLKKQEAQDKKFDLPPLTPNGVWEEFVSMGPQMAAQATAGLASGGVALPLFMMSTQIAGGHYRKMEDKGVDPVRNYASALANAGLQLPLEALSLSKMLKIFKASGYDQVAHAVGESMATQWLQEWSQQYVESGAEIYAQGKGKTPEQMVKQFGDDFLQATKDGVHQGAIAALWGPVMGAGSILNDVGKVHFENKMQSLKDEYAAQRGKFGEASTPAPEVSTGMSAPASTPATESAKTVAENVPVFVPDSVSEIAGSEPQAPLPTTGETQGESLPTAQEVPTPQPLDVSVPRGAQAAMSDGPITPSKPMSVSEVAETPDTAPAHAAPLHWMVQQVLDLTGKYPQVQKLNERLMGYYQPPTQKTGLNRELGKNKEELNRTIGHELYHVVRDISTKGEGKFKDTNVLAHMASLIAYDKAYVSGGPFSPAMMTKDEVASLRGRVKGELQALSAEWRPWDRAKATKKEIAYRDKASELVADAFSALLNNPDYAKAKAPTFFEGFMAYLHNNPKLAASYQDLQDMMTAGSKLEVFRMADDKAAASGIQARLREAEAEATEKKAESRASTWRRYVNRFAATKAFVRKHGMGIVTGPWAALNDWRYVATPQGFYADEMLDRFVAPLKEAGISESTARLYVKSKGILGARADVISGMGDTEAKEFIAETDLLHPEMKSIYENGFAAVRGETIIPLLLRSDMLPKAYKDKIRSNPDYARFQYESKLDEDGGGGGAVSVPKGLTGSVEMSMDTLVETFLGDAQMMERVFRSDAIAEQIKALQEKAPESVRPAEKKFVNGVMQFVEPKRGSGLGLLKNVRNGEVVAHYVPADIAAQFRAENLSDSALTGIMKIANIFKGLYTTYSLSFAIGNPIRDFTQSMANLPEVKGAPIETKIVQAYAMSVADLVRIGGKDAAKAVMPVVKALGAKYPGFEKAVRDYANSVGKEESAQRFLSRTGGKVAEGNPNAWFGLQTGRPEAFDYLLKQFGYAPPAEGWKANRVSQGLGTALNTMDKAIQTTEYLGKGAGVYYLRGLNKSGLTNYTEAEIAQIVREFAGTPNLLMAGSAGAIMNSLFLYMNPWLSGLGQARDAYSMNPKSWLKRQIKFAVVPGMAMAALKYGKWGLGAATVYQGFGFFTAPDDDDKDKKKLELARKAYMNQEPTAGLSYTDLYRGIPDSEFINRWNVVVGVDANGKIIYLSVPKGEISIPLSQLAYSMTAAALSKGDYTAMDATKQIGRALFGNIPSFMPIISIGQEWGMFLGGKAPVNLRTGNPMIPQDVVDAGGAGSLKAMAEASLRAHGGALGALIQFKSYDPLEIATEFELSMNSSYFARTMKAFLRSTDRGYIEEYQRAADKLSAPRKEAMRNVQEILPDAIKGFPLKDGERELLIISASAYPEQTRSWIMSQVQKHNEGFIGKGLRGANRMEKAEIIFRRFSSPVIATPNERQDAQNILDKLGLSAEEVQALTNKIKK